MSITGQAEISILIEQAGLTEVYKKYPEDVLIALEQAKQYNQTIKALDIEKRIPGTTYTPGAGS